MKIVHQVFDSFSCDLAFEQIVNCNHFSLQNKDIKFDIFFENHFEVNTFFKYPLYNTTDVNLELFLKQLNIDGDIVSLISSNQITSEDYLIKYLYAIKDCVLLLLNIEENKMLEALKKYSEYNMDYQKKEEIRDILNSLDDLWRKKEYCDYIVLFKTNNAIIKNVSKYKLAYNRFLYAMGKIDDVSLF